MKNLELVENYIKTYTQLNDILIKFNESNLFNINFEEGANEYILEINIKPITTQNEIVKTKTILSLESFYNNLKELNILNKIYIKQEFIKKENKIKIYFVYKNIYYINEMVNTIKYIYSVIIDRNNTRELFQKAMNLDNSFFEEPYFYLPKNYINSLNYGC